MRTDFLCVSVLRVASGPRVKLASCLGRWGWGAAVCDCDTPWTFLLPFFLCDAHPEVNKIGDL